MKLLLLCFALFGLVASESKSWLISTWKGPKDTNKISFPMSTLVSEFSVHLIISDVAFITGSQSEVQRLEAMGFEVRVERYQRNKDLFVLEFPEKLLSQARETFANHKEFKQSLIWDLFDSKLAVVNSAEFESENVEWTRVVESVRIPHQAIIPGPSFKDNPLYAHVQKIQFDPTIGFVLSDISSQQLYNYVYDLSEGFYTRQSASPQLVEAQGYVIDVLKSYGFNVTTHTYRSDYAYNVCADWAGADNPENYVVVGAHIDSRSTDTNNPSLRAPGAVDNGSGTAGMLEIARVIAKNKVVFSNTVRICIWTGEEQGLLGSDAYAKEMKQNNEIVLAYFNADMTGYQLPNTKITLGMKDRSITEWLLELSYDITATYVPELPVALSSSCCSDYISFYNQGYPSIGYFQNAGGASDYPSYHMSTDTYEKINYEQMRLETEAVMAALMTFAAPYPLIPK